MFDICYGNKIKYCKKYVIKQNRNIYRKYVRLYNVTFIVNGEINTIIDVSTIVIIINSSSNSLFN